VIRRLRLRTTATVLALFIAVWGVPFDQLAAGSTKSTAVTTSETTAAAPAQSSSTQSSAAPVTNRQS